MEPAARLAAEPATVHQLHEQRARAVAGISEPLLQHPQDVEDHVEALLAVLERGKPGETYNVGGKNEMANIDLVRLLCRHLDTLSPREDGRPHEDAITFVTDRPGHDLRYAIDAGRIERELGWTPRHDRSTGFEQTVRWYLEHRSWWEAILSGDYRLERLGTAAAG